MFKAWSVYLREGGCGEQAAVKNLRIDRCEKGCREGSAVAGRVVADGLAMRVVTEWVVIISDMWKGVVCRMKTDRLA